MPDYQQAKIYKIVSDQTDEIYVGSTCEYYLSSRLGGHRGDLKRNHGQLSSFKLLQYPDHKIVLLELYPCQNDKELRTRERYWVERLPNVVNKIRPIRTREEKKQESLDYSREHRNKYRDKYIAYLTKYNQMTRMKKYLTKIKQEHEQELRQIELDRQSVF